LLTISGTVPEAGNAGTKKSGCIVIYQGFPDNEIMLCKNDSMITGLSSSRKGNLSYYQR
jgi:hypothetical protein